MQWASEPKRSLDDLNALFQQLAWAFGDTAFVVGDLPELERSAFVFPTFSELISRLLAASSQGAFQQYLFAALLAEYVEATILERRLVVTKPLFQSDRSAGTAGDVEVRAGQNLEAVYEVSASNWRTKLAQAVDALTTRDELTAITILAAEVPTAGGEITAAIVASDLPSGVDGRRLDVAVLDLGNECRSLAAKLSVRERANAVRRLYDYLVKFCRTQPSLVGTLLQELSALGLTEPPTTLSPGTTPM